MKVWIPVKEFSLINRVVHHVSAVLFIGALLLMIIDSVYGSSDAMKLHQSFGAVVFLLYFGRIVAMSWFGHPEPLGNKIEVFIGKMAHVVLYGILLIMPFTGWLVNAARALPTNVFGVFSIPGFAERNHDLYLMALDTHSFLEYVCWALLLMHVGAMCIHHFVLKQDHVKRMITKLDSEA